MILLFYVLSGFLITVKRKIELGFKFPAQNAAFLGKWLINELFRLRFSLQSTFRNS